MTMKWMLKAKQSTVAKNMLACQPKNNEIQKK